MKSLDRELSRHRKANPKIYNGAKFAPVTIGQTAAPAQTVPYSEPEAVSVPMYTQQPTIQTQIQQMPVIDPQYEQYMAEKQARQDAFDLAINNMYNRLPNPTDRLA